MSVTTERVDAGLYHIYDENGYQLAIIRNFVRATRPWIITYTGGKPGGATPTLKTAVQRVNNHQEE